MAHDKHLKRFGKFVEDTGTCPMGMFGHEQDYKKCPECGGDGKSGGTSGWGQRRPVGVCYTCQGTGYVHKLQEVASPPSFSQMLQNKIDKQNKRTADTRAAMADLMMKVKARQNAGVKKVDEDDASKGARSTDHDSFLGWGDQQASMADLVAKIKARQNPGIKKPKISGSVTEDGAGGGAAPANSAGGGHIAGIGQPPGSHFGEPGIDLRKKRKKLDEHKIAHASDSPRIPIIMTLQHQLADVQYRQKRRPQPALREKEQEILNRIHQEYDLIRDELNETRYVWVCSKCGKIFGPADEDSDSVKCPRCGSTHATRRDDSELDEDAPCVFCEDRGWVRTKSEGISSWETCPGCKNPRDYPYPASLGEETKPDDQFAGADVFEVDTGKFMNSRFGKNRYHRYSRYVGEDEKGQAIRQHGRTNRKRDIILKDQTTGAMEWFLRRKKP